MRSGRILISRHHDRCNTISNKNLTGCFQVIDNRLKSSKIVQPGEIASNLLQGNIIFDRYCSEPRTNADLSAFLIVVLILS